MAFRWNFRMRRILFARFLCLNSLGETNADRSLTSLNKPNRWLCRLTCFKAFSMLPWTKMGIIMLFKKINVYLNNTLFCFQYQAVLRTVFVQCVESWSRHGSLCSGCPGHCVIRQGVSPVVVRVLGVCRWADLVPYDIVRSTRLRIVMQVGVIGFFWLPVFFGHCHPLSIIYPASFCQVFCAIHHC